MRPNFSFLSFSLAGSLCLSLVSANAQNVSGFANPAGYSATLLGISGSAFAVAPDGKFALAQDSFGGGGTITVYDSIGANRHALATFSAPAGDTFQFFGGIAWKDANTLAFSENGSVKTADAFSASLTTGTVTPLAPLGSLPNVADIAYKPGDASGTLYAGTAGGPNANAVYTIVNGVATPFSTGLGGGYLGGLAFRPTDGALFVGDTNDTTFTQTPGQVLQIGANGSVVNTISLAGGGGGDVSGLTFDPKGDLFAATDSTISEIANGGSAAVPFGAFTGGGPYYPGGLQFFGGDFTPFGGGSGTLLVNGGFTNVSGLFALTPASVPEPSALALAGIGGLVCGAGLRRRKGKRA